MIKNAELDGLVTSLSLLRKIYSESEVGDINSLSIKRFKYEDVYKDLLSQIEKLERLIASGVENDTDYLKSYRAGWNDSIDSVIKSQPSPGYFGDDMFQDGFNYAVEEWEKKINDRRIK